MPISNPTDPTAPIAAHTAIGDAHHFKPLIKREHRSMAASSGSVGYTGYGFRPTGLLVISNNRYDKGSIGIADPARDAICYWYNNSDSEFEHTWLLRCGSSVSDYQKAGITSYDADGFTLQWTKAGSPTGDLDLIVIAFN